MRTVAHLEKNGVDLARTPISIGPLLRFDPDNERFPDSPLANELLTRSYRQGFVCPSANDV